MRNQITMALLTATLALSSGASAHGWGGGDRGWGGHDRYQQGYDDGWVRAICSGYRADNLEDRLKQSRRYRGIDDWQARRIHDEIDRLEDQQKRECREGDLRELRAIAAGYAQIDRWIDRAEGRGRERYGYGW